MLLIYTALSIEVSHNKKGECCICNTLQLYKCALLAQKLVKKDYHYSNDWNNNHSSHSVTKKTQDAIQQKCSWQTKEY